MTLHEDEGMITDEPHRRQDTRTNFDAVLGDLQLGMAEIGALIADNLRRAGEAMRHGRLELIAAVRGIDGEIDRRCAELERTTFETIARQQPVARDLRFLIAATRVLYEQERSGDLVVNCMNMLEREEGFPDVPGMEALLSRAVDTAAGLVDMSVDALSNMYEDAGARLDAADDELDDLISRYYTEIGAEAENIGLETAIVMSRVGRFLERIGDHAVNIAENVTYIVTSELRFSSRAVPSDEA
jgi:phosphate transport system protein